LVAALHLIGERGATESDEQQRLRSLPGGSFLLIPAASTEVAHQVFWLAGFMKHEKSKPASDVDKAKGFNGGTFALLVKVS
jgi:hypothetical protein